MAKSKHDGDGQWKVGRTPVVEAAGAKQRLIEGRVQYGKTHSQQRDEAQRKEWNALFDEDEFELGCKALQDRKRHADHGVEQDDFANGPPISLTFTCKATHSQFWKRLSPPPRPKRPPMISPSPEGPLRMISPSPTPMISPSPKPRPNVSLSLAPGRRVRLRFASPCSPSPARSSPSPKRRRGAKKQKRER